MQFRLLFYILIFSKIKYFIKSYLKIRKHHQLQLVFILSGDGFVKIGIPSTIFSCRS